MKSSNDTSSGCSKIKEYKRMETVATSRIPVWMSERFEGSITLGINEEIRLFSKKSSNKLVFISILHLASYFNTLFGSRIFELRQCSSHFVLLNPSYFTCTQIHEDCQKYLIWLCIVSGLAGFCIFNGGRNESYELISLNKFKWGREFVSCSDNFLRISV